MGEVFVVTDFPIPDAALAQHVIIVGQTGSGKSTVARAVVERLLTEGRRVCVIDYTGVWYGLRSNLAGDGPGFPAVLFGGEHADVPLNEFAGPAVAAFVAEGTQPTVIDLDGLTIGAQQRFVTAFCEELYRTNTRPLHLIFEEADEFAPMTGAPGAERMIGAVCRIFQRGRRKGFRAMAITQRPANLHTRVRAQCKSLVALSLALPHDVKAVRLWVQSHADDARGRELLDTLAGLPRGDAWVWAPEQHILHRTRFPAITTFDSMRAPEEGEFNEPTEWANTDLDAVRAYMAELVEEAKANDPATLKAEVRRLTAELNKRTAGLEADVDAQGYQRGFDEAFAMGVASLGEYWKFLIPYVGKVKSAVDELDMAHMIVFDTIEGRAEGAPTFKDAPREIWDRMTGKWPDILAHSNSTAEPAASKPPMPRAVESAEGRATRPTRANGPDEALTRPQLNVLRAMTWWAAMGHDAPTRAQIAAIVGWTPNGSNLRLRLGELLRTEHIVREHGDRFRLTGEGRAVAPEPDTQQTLIATIRTVLTAPQCKVFDALLDSGSVAMTREAIGRVVGWEPDGSNLRLRLGELRRLELVTQSHRGGAVALSDWVREGRTL